MELQMINGQGTVEVADGLLSREFNEPLIHQVIVAYQASGRSGTKAQKSRSEVRGGGSKPWRQKGTGRARAGSIRSPIWVGGGCTFAAKPRSYAQKINKKMYRGAMGSILSELNRKDRLKVVAPFNLLSSKTKDFLVILKQLIDTQDVLIVVSQIDEKLYLGARNIPRVEVIEANAVDPVSLIRHEYVIVTVDALRQMEEWLA